MPPRVPPPFVDQNAIHDSPPPSKKEISKTMDNVPRVSIRKKNDTPAGWFGVNCGPLQKNLKKLLPLQIPQSQVGIHPPLSDNWRNRFESTSGGDRKGWPQSSPLIQSKTSTSPWPQTKDSWWRIVHPEMHPPPPFPKAWCLVKNLWGQVGCFFGDVSSTLWSVNVHLHHDHLQHHSHPPTIHLSAS